MGKPDGVNLVKKGAAPLPGPARFAVPGGNGWWERARERERREAM